MRSILLTLLIPSLSATLRVTVGTHSHQLLRQVRPAPVWNRLSKVVGASSLSMSAQRGGEGMGHIVSAEWLRDNLANENVKVLDSSWYLYPKMERSPGVPFDAHKEFSQKRVSGALFFDIDKICDPMPDPPELPHMFPSAELFGKCVSELGISKDNHVILYDGKGQFSSARGWYMFKAFGHKDVSILDGGLPAWEKAGCKLDTAPLDATTKAAVPTKYLCDMIPTALIYLKDVEENIQSKSFQLIDGRPRPRFMGEAPEPRPIESGHIEGSFCVPWSDVVDADGIFYSPDQLRKILTDNGVDLSKPTAVTCGSGVSACVVAAALTSVGIPVTETSLYDGAYSEWKLKGHESFKGMDKTNYFDPSQQAKKPKL